VETLSFTIGAISAGVSSSSGSGMSVLVASTAPTRISHLQNRSDRCDVLDNTRLALTVQGIAWDAAKVTATETQELPDDAGWGPTSRRVAANLKRLREARGLSTTRLSKVLKDEVGHSIP